MNTSLKQNNYKKTQRGLSLIELLIAMLIGLFLLTGIATSYLSSKNSSNKRDELTKLEDNGRLALEVLTQAIEHTGYTPINAGILNPPFVTDDAQVVTAACDGGGNGVKERKIFKTRITKDGAAGDAITVMYNGDNRVFRDCSGGVLPVLCRAPPPGAAAGSSSDMTRIYNAFYLGKKDKKLRCAGSRDAKAQVIADGIENIQYLYGLNTTRTDGGVDRYVNAANVGTNWNNVVSVQIAILVRSEKPVKPQKEKITYTLLDQSVVAGDDKHQRAVFTTTIRIRNTL